MNRYVAFINQFVPLTEEEKLMIEPYTSEKIYKKGEIIYSRGEVCTHLLYIIQGYARSYSIDMNGREFTWNLNFNDQDSKFRNLYTFDYSSFLAQEPSELYVEAITDITVIRMAYKDMQTLFTLNNKFQLAGRVMAETAFRSIQKRTFSLLTMTAEARYELMLKEEPKIMQKFQQYYIASYLGITPQSLSRLRSTSV